MIYQAYLSTDLNSKETNTYEITSRRRRSQILVFYFSVFIFKENRVLVEDDNPSNSFGSQDEELDVIDDIDHIWNSEDLLRIAIMHQECGILKVFVDGGELTRNINKNRKPGVWQTYRCLLCDKFYRREDFFNKHVEYCK